MSNAEEWLEDPHYDELDSCEYCGALLEDGRCPNDPEQLYDDFIGM